MILLTQGHVVRQEGGAVVVDVGHHDLHLNLVKFLKKLFFFIRANSLLPTVTQSTKIILFPIPFITLAPSCEDPVRSSIELVVFKGVRRGERSLLGH
jgi:hypothetical protein